jgi:hypothetical protein
LFWGFAHGVRDSLDRVVLVPSVVVDPGHFERVPDPSLDG